MRKKHPPKIAEAPVKILNKNGYGLATLVRQDGTEKFVEIPFTMPGDIARFQIVKNRSGTAIGQLQEILHPSPDRQAPRCVHFGVCGGCRWQHIPYKQQLKIKQGVIEKNFRNLVDPDTKIHPAISCEPPWAYRNKMEFSFSNDKAGNQYLGLMMSNTRGRVLNLQECHLVNPWFVEALKITRQWWLDSGLTAYHPPSDRGSLRTLTLREGMRTGDRMAILTVSGNPEFALQQHHLDRFVALLTEGISPKNAHLSLFLRIHQIAKGMATNFFEMALTESEHIREILYPFGEALNFLISPSAFFQPNPRQAEKLYGLALELLDLSPNSIVFDLYCGTGTLGICAAKKAKKVIGVELSPESVLDARANASRNGFHNVEIFSGAVSDVVGKIRQEGLLPQPDAIMVDPPRSGLDPGTIRHLLALSPRKILYISCNPVTQAENIKELKQGGYSLTALQPVDQFPQTPHLENIAILTKHRDLLY